VRGETGVGHDRVQPPERLDGGVDRRPDVVVHGGVTDECQQPVGLPEFLGEAAQPFLPAPGDGDPLPRVQQPPRHGGADPTATAGDERNPRVGHGFPLRFLPGLRSGRVVDAGECITWSALEVKAWGLSFGSDRRRGAWHAHLRRCRRLPMLRIDALLRLAAARTRPRSPALKRCRRFPAT
jgi:hypothetical protein